MANAKTKARLTKTLVNGLETREREYAVWDTECESFHVRVLSTGTKAFYVYYRDERGKQSRRSLGRANVVAVDAARKNAQSILADQRRGFDHFYELDKKLKIPTLSEFWPDYLEYHAIPKKSERSVVEDRSLWKNHLSKQFGALPISDISRLEIRNWHAKKNNQKASANRALSLLSKMMTLCVENEWISANPCAGLPRYPEKAKERFLTSAEIKRLFATLQNEPDVGGATMIKLLLLTGARRGEALKADWQEFDLDGGFWNVPTEHIKGGERLDLKICRPLNSTALELMRAWRKTSGRIGGTVFPSTKDPSKRRYDVKSVWERACSNAELPGLRLHDLRHTFASIALEHGVTLDQIGHVLGHKNPQTTRRYAHLSHTASAVVAEKVGDAIASAVGNIS